MSQGNPWAPRAQNSLLWLCQAISCMDSTVTAGLVWHWHQCRTYSPHPQPSLFFITLLSTGLGGIRSIFRSIPQQSSPISVESMVTLILASNAIDWITSILKISFPCLHELLLVLISRECKWCLEQQGERLGGGRLMRGPVCIKEVNYVTGLNGSTESLALPWHQLYALKVYLWQPQRCCCMDANFLNAART